MLPEEVDMVTAIILLSLDRDKITETGEMLAQMEGVTEIYSVAGKYDMVAIVKAAESEKLMDLVTNHILKVKGIAETETLFAFRVYSRKDLECMFSIGMGI